MTTRLMPRNVSNDVRRCFGLLFDALLSFASIIIADADPLFRLLNNLKSYIISAVVDIVILDAGEYDQV